MSNLRILSSANLKGIHLFKKGKVRDVYDLDDKLLVISTDRISCFDVILPTCIPNKGAILTQLSVFWFEFTRDIIPNHLITTNVETTTPGMASKAMDFQFSFNWLRSICKAP